MSYLLGMSFDLAASPSIALKSPPRRIYNHRQPFGWGIAWYPEGDQASVVIKDPTAIKNSAMTELLKDWKRFRASVFLCHIQGAAKRRTQQDTHPFSRSYARRTWLIAHTGDLEHDFAARLPMSDGSPFEPIGRTDSEYIFCWLLSRIADAGARSLKEVGWPRLHGWLREINAHGTANVMITDGVDLVVYRDHNDFGSLYWTRRRPPHQHQRFENEALTLNLDDPMNMNQTLCLFSTTPLSDDTRWLPVEAGGLMVARRGALQWCSYETPRALIDLIQTGDRADKPVTDEEPLSMSQEPPTPATPPKDLPPPPSPDADTKAPTAASTAASAPQPLTLRDVGAQPVGAQSRAASPNATGAASATPMVIAERTPETLDDAQPAEPPDDDVTDTAPHDGAGREGGDMAERHRVRPVKRPKARYLRVVHETTYRYANPIDLSTHVLRLRPVHDHHQQVLDYRLEISPKGVWHSYDDVFGNHATRLDFEEPYKVMSLRSESVLRMTVPTRLAHSFTNHHDSIPLVWMPWHRDMMHPYLLPMELPVSQLRALSDYAMSFVERQDHDLIETLLDINETIYRDYDYVPGSTNVATTPFEVFVNRRGVCQDFANLFICLARLLNIPARYRVGYIYTGANYDNTIQSEASHAWAELYLPLTGWRGFDPTNGCLAGQDHIRVACGRNYRDATPTSGTIYRGGGGERLSVEVRVEEIDAP